MKSIFASFAIVCMLITGCTDRSLKEPIRPIEETITPLLAWVYEPTAPVLGSDSKYHLLYGLMLTNASSNPITIEKIEILDYYQNASTIKIYKEDDLKPFLKHLDSSIAENSTLEKDSSRVLFISLEFESKEKLPKAIIHKLSINSHAKAESKYPKSISYEAGSFCLCMKEPLVISPPLKGNGWTIFNGCCSFGGAHQTTLIPVNGVLFNSQRFAVDFMKLDDHDRLVEGDPAVPENWHCYDEKIYAVADGTVISVLDGVPDQPPGSLPERSSITIKNITGNHVILQLNETTYALFAHIKNGSIKVKTGEKVSRGSEIGRIGNSGNTSAPHLHLHLGNTSSPLGSSPLPFVFDSFKVVGIVSRESFYEAENLEKAFGNRKEFTPDLHSQQLPMDLTILDF